MLVIVVKVADLYYITAEYSVKLQGVKLLISFSKIQGSPKMLLFDNKKIF